MKNADLRRRAARRSLVSVVLAAIATTAHHLYTLGPRAWILGLALTLLPAGLWVWYRRTGSRVAGVGYLVMAAWIVLGFGLKNGLWDNALRLFLGTLLGTLSTSFAPPVVGTFGYEASAILTFYGALHVLWSAVRFVEAEHPATAAGRPPLRRRWVVVAAIAAVGLVGAYVVAARDGWRPPSDGVVRIGVVVPTTGAYSILGTSFLRAAEMAAADLRDTRLRYRLVVADTPPDPLEARAAIERLIREQKVDAVVGGISLIGQVTQPLATEARIPHVCVCTVATIADGAYNFTNIPSPRAEAELWVREARRRGLRRVALLTQDYPSIVNHVKALESEMARGGLEIVSGQVFGAERVDFAPLIATARAGRPDVYYVEALEPGLDLLGAQLSGAGIHDIASVVAPSVSERPELFEGAWYTDSNLPDMAFKERFEALYPDTKFATHMMPYAYDAVKMIVGAFEGGENPAVYLRNLRRYPGTAGLLTKKKGSGIFESTPAVWVIREGKPRLVGATTVARAS